MKFRLSRKRMREYVIVALLSAFILWFLYLVVDLYRKEELARDRAQKTAEELAVLREREATLASTLADLHTPRGREATLRETFGVAKEHEEVIIVVPQEEPPPPPPLPWWKKFFGWFGFW
jgi:cell division protein FtsB